MCPFLAHFVKVIKAGAVVKGDESSGVFEGEAGRLELGKDFGGKGRHGGGDVVDEILVT